MIKTYKKPNGDLNLDIESVIATYPEIAGSKCDDEEQKAISVALVPYIINKLNNNTDNNFRKALLFQQMQLYMFIVVFIIYLIYKEFI